MKQGQTSKVQVSKIVVVIIIMAAFAQQSLAEVRNGQVQMVNIGGNALATLLRGALEGNVKNLKDAGKMLLVGGLAGFGFYQSKKMAANNQITPAVLLANISASVTENVALGNHPLSHFAYTLGPVRMKVATPFNRKEGGTISVDVSPKDVVGLVISLKRADKISFRNGMITFTAAEPFGKAIGWCYGMFPTVMAGTADNVYAHEVVHVIQNLQFMAASYEPFMSKPDHKSTFKFNGLRLQSLGVVADLSLSQFSYEKNFKEMEAFFFSGNGTEN